MLERLSSFSHTPSITDIVSARSFPGTLPVKITCFALFTFSLLSALPQAQAAPDTRSYTPPGTREQAPTGGILRRIAKAFQDESDYSFKMAKKAATCLWKKVSQIHCEAVASRQDAAYMDLQTDNYVKEQARVRKQANLKKQAALEALPRITGSTCAQKPASPSGFMATALAKCTAFIDKQVQSRNERGAQIRDSEEMAAKKRAYMRDRALARQQTCLQQTSTQSSEEPTTVKPAEKPQAADSIQLHDGRSVTINVPTRAQPLAPGEADAMTKDLIRGIVERFVDSLTPEEEQTLSDYFANGANPTKISQAKSILRRADQKMGDALKDLLEGGSMQKYSYKAYVAQKREEENQIWQIHRQALAQALQSLWNQEPGMSGGGESVRAEEDFTSPGRADFFQENQDQLFGFSVQAQVQRSTQGHTADPDKPSGVTIEWMMPTRVYEQQFPI